MELCPICQKHTKETELMLYQDQYVWVCHYMPDQEGDTNFLGYYFIEMKRHFDGIQNATDEELEAMMKITKRLAKALMQRFGGERIYTFIIGDGVKHMHEHVVIKHHGTPREYRGPKVDEWSGTPRGGYEDILY